jgi:hypothetical protein
MVLEIKQQISSGQIKPGAIPGDTSREFQASEKGDVKSPKEYFQYYSPCCYRFCLRKGISFISSAVRILTNVSSRVNLILLKAGS